MPPIFEFTDHYDTTVTIFGKALPIKVKRYSRPEMEAFEQRQAEVSPPRGSAPLEPADQDRIEQASRSLIEELITDAITLEPGLVVDRGVAVVDGDGLIGMFHQRRDVLGDLAAAVLIQNRLAGHFAKNSNSPRATDTGSAPSIQATGEGKSDSIAASAEASNSATSSAATAASGAAPAAVLTSSGTASGVTAPT